MTESRTIYRAGEDANNDTPGVILPEDPAALYARTGELEAALVVATQRAEAAEETAGTLRAECRALARKIKTIEVERDGLKSERINLRLDTDRLRAQVTELTTALERNLAAMETANTTADSLFQRAEAAEAKLAAVPVDELRRWYEHSEVSHAVNCGLYNRDDAGYDMSVIRYWLDGNEEDGVPPAYAYVGLEVQP